MVSKTGCPNFFPISILLLLKNEVDKFLTNIQPAVVKVDLGGCVAWVVLVAACWSAEAVSPAVLGFPPPTADDL